MSTKTLVIWGVRRFLRGTARQKFTGFSNCRKGPGHNRSCLFFLFCEEVLVFLNVSPFFSRDFMGFGRDKKSFCFFLWLSLPFSKKKQGREGQGQHDWRYYFMRRPYSAIGFRGKFFFCDAPLLGLSLDCDGPFFKERSGGVAKLLRAPPTHRVPNHPSNKKKIQKP